MALPTIPYRRLPGVGTNAFEYCRLYLGPDHLLLVSSSGYAESYKRFFFRDIQSITIRKSSLGKVWNVVWGLLFWIFGVAVALEAGGGAMYFWLGVAAIFLVLLIWNIGRGPTCVTQITTAVQTRTLAPLNRLRRARQVLAQLRPLIEATQGTLTSDELNRQLEQARRGGTPVAQSLPTTEASGASETSLPPAG